MAQYISKQIDPIKYSFDTISIGPASKYKKLVSLLSHQTKKKEKKKNPRIGLVFNL